MTTNLSVNGNRLWDTLMVSAGIGTGCIRPSLLAQADSSASWA